MRFLSFRKGHRKSWGVIDENGIIDMGCRYDSSLFEILRQERLTHMCAKAVDLSPDLAPDDESIEFLPPVGTPEKIICIGVNYMNRNAEYRDGSSAPRYPSVFMRTPDSFTGHGSPLVRPPESRQLDYEGEIVLVIGKQGRRIAERDVHEYIAGFTIMNEGTLRDWVRHAKFNVTQGKNFVHSGSIGPWMVTATEFPPEKYSDMHVSTRVNGELRQADTTANMMFPIRYIIHYLSKFFLLKPGDLIATGTPNGAGARLDPPRYLTPGDIVEVTVEGMGTLSNGVADEFTLDSPQP